MITNSDLTIYNHYVDSFSKSVYYKRTVLKGVEWQNTKASNVRSTGGDIAANQAAIFIPMANRTGYKSPKQWQALADKTGFWTIQVEDYVVRGVVTDEVPTSITMPGLIAKYDDVLRVASVDPMDSGSMALRHWEVGAK